MTYEGIFNSDQYLEGLNGNALLQVVTAKVDQVKDTAASYKLPGINKNRCFNLLVIDDQKTDW